MAMGRQRASHVPYTSGQQAKRVQPEQITEPDTTRALAGDLQRQAQLACVGSFEDAVRSHAHRQAERLRSVGYRHEARSIRRFVAQHTAAERSTP